MLKTTECYCSMPYSIIILKYLYKEPYFVFKIFFSKMSFEKWGSSYNQGRIIFGPIRYVSVYVSIHLSIYQSIYLSIIYHHGSQSGVRGPLGVRDA